MGLVVAIDGEAASKVSALVNRDARDHIGLLARQHGEALGEKKDGLAHSYHKLYTDRVEHECGGLGLAHRLAAALVHVMVQERNHGGDQVGRRRDPIRGTRVPRKRANGLGLDEAGYVRMGRGPTPAVIRSRSRPSARRLNKPHLLAPNLRSGLR